MGGGNSRPDLGRWHYVTGSENSRLALLLHLQDGQRTCFGLASWGPLIYDLIFHFAVLSQLMAPIPILCLFRSLNRYRHRNDKIPPQPPQPTLSLMLHGLDRSQFSRLIQECKEKPIWRKSQRAHSLLWKIDGGWQEFP